MSLDFEEIPDPKGFSKQLHQAELAISWIVLIGDKKFGIEGTQALVTYALKSMVLTR